MAYEFSGKSAFVTGGASGIGLAIAQALLDAGARVMIADIEKAALERVIETLRPHGEVAGVVCDVGDPASMQVAAKRAFDHFGHVHLLFNNAGVGFGGPQHMITAADWRWVLDVNLDGVIHGVLSFVPHMLTHGEPSHIVNTASMAGMLSTPMMGPYCASKFAVVAMSEGLAAELAASKIGVSVLCPGWVRTRIHESRRNHPSAGEAHPPVAALSQMAAEIAEKIRTGLDPALLAARVLDAIRDNDLYIFTHPEMRDSVEERFARINAAFDKAQAYNQAHPQS